MGGIDLGQSSGWLKNPCAVPFGIAAAGFDDSDPGEMPEPVGRIIGERRKLFGVQLALGNPARDCRHVIGGYSGLRYIRFHASFDAELDPALITSHNICYIKVAKGQVSCRTDRHEACSTRT